MPKKPFKSAETVATAEGLQYHIGLKPGDVAQNILLCGDPQRAHRVAAYFEKTHPVITNREYVTITGTYRGLALSVMSTGIGPDNMEIAFVELLQIVRKPTLIRIGSSSALSEDIKLGDLIIATGSVRLENTSTAFVMEGYPAVAHHEAIIALIEAARGRGFAHHVGLAASAPGFYASQGRHVPGFAPREPKLPARLGDLNVLNFEMEGSCLFTLAALKGVRAGMVCAVYGNRHSNTFVDDKLKDIAERRCIETGLEAFRTLSKIDRAKGKERFWVPSMGI